MFDKLFSKDIGIDLGTRNTVVFVKGHGIYINEPSMVALDKKTKQVLAIGNEAFQMVGRTPGNIIAIRPMKDGVIADFDITEKMIKSFIQKLNLNTFFCKPRILIGIPWGITAVEKRAVFDAAYMAGAREALLIDEPMAAAIGSNVDVEKPNGCMVVDIGGGTTEIAVISLAGIVNCISLRIAGDEFDEAIISHCRKNYKLLIGERMAERVKIEVGSAMPFENEKSVPVKGRDLVSGLPRTFSLSSFEIRDALAEPIHQIVHAIKLTLEKTPPELSGDIMTDGILLTGGGSLIHGLDAYIKEATNIPVVIAKNPLTCVAEGTGKVLENPGLMEKISSTLSF